MKQKAFSIILKWLPTVRNCLRPKSGPLRHSESASDLQQCLYVMYKKKIGILGVGTKIFLITLLQLESSFTFSCLPQQNVLELLFFSAHIFLGFIQSFWVFGHGFTNKRQKDNFFNIFGFSATIFFLFFVKLRQHMQSGVYQVFTRHIFWESLVQKFKIVSLS